MATITAPNPFASGVDQDRATQPAQLVIFGATGDLTKRKLLPAVYNLAQAQLLPPGFCMVGFARDGTCVDDDFRKRLSDAVATSGDVRVKSADVLKDLSSRTHYRAGDFHDPKAYVALKAELEKLDGTYGTAGNRIFYIATPASLFGDIVQQLHDAGMIESGPDRPFTRIIVEKPFGRDLASAKQLNTELLRYLGENQIYRIDHYLGKETVQNILVFRFANGIFEPIWNRRYVDHVEITVAESLGIEGRASFYEETGVVRDVIQNHALQLLSLVAMESVTSFDANDFRDEKVRVVKAIRPIPLDEVDTYAVRGQYGPGFIDGADVVGYRQEPGINADSPTPTFAAFKFVVDNWRWAGVPFYVRSGKRMTKRVTEIVMQFKQAPHLPFRNAHIGELEGNVLALRIQPDEGITLKFGAKVPGPNMRIRSVNMDFGYGATFGREDSSPYERLILDCMKGVQTLFDRSDGVEAAWALIDPVLTAWAAKAPTNFPNYAAGTWGPPEADALLAEDSRSWRRL